MYFQIAFKQKLMTRLICAMSIGLFLSQSANAQTSGTLIRPNGNTEWYYTIGGGDPYVYYRQSDKTTLTLGVGVEWSLWKGCKFDPTFGISETFKDMKQNVYGLSNTVLNDATAVFTGWGLSKIQENWPGLYDTLNKGLKDAKETFTLSVKNCHDVQNDLKNHRNPADDWISISRESSWAKASQSGANPVTAGDAIESNAGDQGVAWVGGTNAGGENQPMIHIVADTITAGYDHLVGDVVPSIVGGGVPQVTGDQSIVRVFADSDAAAKWATAVIGERNIRTCVNCQKLQTRVGQGLRKQYSTERDKVTQVLQAILASNKPSTNASDLDKLSVPGMGYVISDDIIISLKNSPYSERMILTNRLVSEIALARSMEKAIIARDLLDAGSQEPNVAANGPAQAEIAKARETLQREIDNVLFEQQVRKEVFSNATTTISRRGEERNKTLTNALPYLTPPRNANDGRMVDGAPSK